MQRPSDVYLSAFPFRRRNRFLLLLKQIFSSFGKTRSFPGHSTMTCVKTAKPMRVEITILKIKIFLKGESR
jgi:hypothetical protein